MNKRLRWGCKWALSAMIVLTAFAATVEAKTFRWANDGDPTTMDPHARGDAFVSSFDFNMYEGLVRRDRDLKLEAALATEWANVNPTTWRFKLRHGVTYHDGSPLTVEDVLFSFQRAIAPGSDLAAQMSAVKEVKKIDDDTVDFITDGPAPILPNYLANVAIMSKAWCEAHNTQRAATLKDEESYATRNANGTGPFMLKDRQPMVRTMLVKNPKWWHLKDQPIDIDEVRVQPRREPGDPGCRAVIGRPGHDLQCPPARHRARREKPGGQSLADSRAADDVSRDGPKPRRTLGIECQRQEPLQGQASAPGVLPGDRRGC